MRAKLSWSPLADADLLAILRYIGSNNSSAAFKIYDRIRDQTSLLETYPAIGRSGRVAGTRELIVVGSPDIVVYRVTGHTVTVLRVIHGSRKWPKRF